MLPNFLNDDYLRAISKAGINIKNKEATKDLDDILLTRFRHDQEKMRSIAKMRSQLLETVPFVDFDLSLFTTPKYSVLHGHKHGTQTFLSSAKNVKDHTYQSINVRFNLGDKNFPSEPAFRTSRSANMRFNEKYTIKEELTRHAADRIKSKDIPLIFITRDPISLFFSGLTQALWAYDGRYYQNEFVKSNPYIGKKLLNLSSDFGTEKGIKRDNIDLENQEIKDFYHSYFQYIISNYSKRLTGDVHLNQIDYCFKYTQLLELLKCKGYEPLIRIINLDEIDSTPYLKKFFITNKFVLEDDNYKVNESNPRHSTKPIKNIVKQAFFDSVHDCYSHFAPIVDHLVRSINTFNLLHYSKNIVYIKADKNNRQTLGQYIHSRK